MAAFLSFRKPAILIVSRDPYFEEMGRADLESAGFHVFTAQRLEEIGTACGSGVSLIVLGHSLSATEKWRVWESVLQECNVPVLEVHGKGGPVLTGATFFHPYPTSDDFLEKVREIVASVTDGKHLAS